MEKVSRGLDLSKPATLTVDEVASMKAFYRHTQGAAHPGLDFWIENGPAQLKHYRLFTTVAQPGLYESDRFATNFAFLLYYAAIGYERGVRYMVRARQRLGITKAQVMEGVAIAFIVVGPAGMETIASALADYEWLEPEKPAIFPTGWAADYHELRSGLDFTRDVMTADELAMLKDWYFRKTGEIPPYIEFLGRYQPNLLKAARNRWENCLRSLPIQFLPTTLLHYEVVRGFDQGIRENVLLARSFGVSKDIALATIFSAMASAWTSAASIVQHAAGDIFESWPDG